MDAWNDCRPQWWEDKRASANSWALFPLSSNTMLGDSDSESSSSSSSSLNALKINEDYASVYARRKEREELSRRASAPSSRSNCYTHQFLLSRPMVRSWLAIALLSVLRRHFVDILLTGICRWTLRSLIAWLLLVSTSCWYRMCSQRKVRLWRLRRVRL